MSCQTYQELISAGLDDELSNDELHELQQHLQGCPACQEYRQQLQRQEQQLRSLPRSLPAPPLRHYPAKPKFARSAFLIGLAASLTLWLGVRALDFGGVRLHFHPHGLHTQPSRAGSLSVHSLKSSPIHGKPHPTRGLDFSLELDSGNTANHDLRLRVDYDYDGDGVVERSETYRPVQTDASSGWQRFTSSVGLELADGKVNAFKAGTITLHLLNASPALRLNANTSWLHLPML